jgi:hypothetical protein
MNSTVSSSASAYHSSLIAGGGMGMTGRGGLPHQINLRRGQGAGLVDEVAEGALQVQSFGGEGAGGLEGAGVGSIQQMTRFAR